MENYDDFPSTEKIKHFASKHTIETSV